MLDLQTANIAVTGGAGFLGRFVCDRLADHGCQSVSVVRSADYDLTTAWGAARMYDDLRPDVVFHLAAQVGGIGANRRRPGRFFYANMAMGLHLIEEARNRRIAKFVQVGTVCAYPKFAPIPFKEEDLWNGYPEETNAPYGVAKKALFVMLDAYYREYGLPSAVVVPVNLYGPGDNFDPSSSHVIPALIRRFEDAADRDEPTVTCWGSGRASREFLYVEDAADGIVKAGQHLDEPTPVNLGTGKEIRIFDLAKQIAAEVGYRGEILWDATKPDGQPRRCLDTRKAEKLLGWQAQTDFASGLHRTVEWYRSALRRMAA